MPSGDESRPGPDPRKAAAYVAALAADLRDLAHRSDLPILSYLLDMARLEAEAVAENGEETRLDEPS
jgi:hypothetical protein